MRAQEFKGEPGKGALHAFTLYKTFNYVAKGDAESTHDQ